MKLKCTPDDFQVDELTQVTPGGGPFALYRLEKRSLGTPEAVAAIARRWRIAREAIAFGGLKDRHAATKQWLTIRNGPRRDLRQSHFTLHYVGQTQRAFASTDIAANAFRVVLRDVAASDCDAVTVEFTLLQRDGLPNYFDRQRFGSLGHSREFIARPWCKGDYARALWLALADPCDSDRPRQQEEKRLFRENWGDWSRCAARLQDSPAQGALAHLLQYADDFRGAMGKLPATQRRMYLAAYQSYLWNRVLAALVREECRPEQLLDVSAGGETVPLFRELDAPQRERLAAHAIPLPSSRLRDENQPLFPLVERVLAQLDVTLRELKVERARDSFFSKGDRAAIFFADQGAWETGDDELYAERKKITLSFTLPRGCYATILAARLAAVCRGQTPDA